MPEENTNKISDLERVGLFSDVYDTEVTLAKFSSPEEYAKLMGRDPKDYNKNNAKYPKVLGTKTKAGTNDWSFSPFIYLYKGDLYKDPWKRFKKDDKNKNISEKPFVPTGQSHCMNGTFDKKPQEYFSPEKKPKSKDEKGLKPFKVNPGKKGTGYGFVVGIGKYPEYPNTPGFNQRAYLKKLREAHKAAMMSDKFIPPGHSGYFNTNPYFDSKYPNGFQKSLYDFDKMKSGKNKINVPWHPSNFTKKINGNKDVIAPLDKFPAYSPSSPWKSLKCHNLYKSVLGPNKPSWKPQFGNRTRQSKSVVNYNIQLAVNPMTFHKY